MNVQLAEAKKRAEEEAEAAAALEEARKRCMKDIEALQRQVEELQAVNDKLDKSKKKVQAELEDSIIELEAQRAKVLELEKKQKNFDKVIICKMIELRTTQFSLDLLFNFYSFIILKNSIKFLLIALLLFCLSNN